MRRILLWGGGGHGKVVADVARAAGWSVTGFVDADPRKLGSEAEPGGGRVLIDEEGFLSHLQREGRLPDGVDAVALCVGDNTRRLRCLERIGSIEVPPLVHPSAVVSPSATIGRATVVMPGVVINAAAVLGDAVIANTGAIIEHDCVIGDGVHLSPNSTLGGGVRIDRGAWIGAGATVIQQVSIGADTIVGAGATVIRDARDRVVLVGVPAREISRSSIERRESA